MKKLLSIICIFSTLLVSSFAKNLFNNRYFEIYATVPFTFSNNVVSLEDIFFTETGQIIIDLERFSNIPDKGFAIDIDTKPVAGFKLDIPKGLVFGAGAGADIYMGMLFSKDFFDFIGSGYECGDEIALKAKKFNADAFAYVKADLGWNTKKASLVIHPSLFVPVFHAEPNNISAVVKNTEDGKFIVDAVADLSIYTNVDIAKDGKFTSDNFAENLKDSALSNAGFDLGISYSWDIFKFLRIGAGAQIPIVPGKLKKTTSLSYSMKYELNPGELITNSLNNDSSASEGEKKDSTESENSEQKKDAIFTDTIDLGSVYSINRPLKFSISADLHTEHEYLSVYGKLGFTAKHAFEPSTKLEDIPNNFSVDYLLGGRLSLLGLINLDLSTERTDQIFAHKATVGFSIRLVEVNAGVSLASTNFLKSFEATGVGAFVNVAVGL